MSISTLNEQSLRQLVATAEPPCISTYIPLSEPGAERDQNRIRLKNQLDRAERELDEQGNNRATIEAMLEPLEAMYDADALLRGGASTLAMFRSPREFETLELPVAKAEVTVVGDTFHVKPLLNLVTLNQRFRLLALCQNDVRVFEGDRFGMQGLDVPKLPTSLRAALNPDDDDDDETMQFHTGAAPRAGDRPAVFHGQGGAKDDAKDRMLRFCQLLDNAIAQHFDDQDIPLILAAPEPMPAVYRNANSYRRLLDNVIHGDPRLRADNELHALAWELAAPLAEACRRGALDELHEGLAKERGTTDLSEALTAAREGRVRTLFVGAAEDDNRSVTSPSAGNAITARPDPQFEQRLNRAVVNTLRYGGRAFAAPCGELPQNAPLAAVYRY